MQRQGSRYSRETRAQALALTTATNATNAGRELGVPARTVRNWVQHYNAETGRNEWDEDNHDVIERSTAKIMEGMEGIPEGQAYKHLMALNAIRGTSIDKLQRGSSSSKAATFVVVRSSDGTEIEVGVRG